MSNTSDKNTEDTFSQSSDSEQSQMYVLEKENKQSSLIIRDHVDKTPFTVVTIEQGSFIAIGNRRITEYMDKDILYEMIELRSWELISNMCMVLIDIMSEKE